MGAALMACDCEFQSTCLREARHLMEHIPQMGLRFQSTCLREARPVRLLARANRRQFQSTCLREARRDLPRLRGRDAHFNPRAYVRHDDEVAPYKVTAKFQSTCLREARPTLGINEIPLDISIHVPT